MCLLRRYIELLFTENLEVLINYKARYSVQSKKKKKKTKGYEYEIPSLISRN